MKKFTIAFLVVCSISVFFAGLFPLSATASPAVLWQPDELVIDAASGSHQMIDVSFSVMQDMRGARIRIVPELEAFISVDPIELGMLYQGESHTVSLQIVLPAGLSPQELKGTLHLEARRGGAHATAARPLPVSLNIQEALSTRLLVTALWDAEDFVPFVGAQVILDGAFVGVTDETGSLEFEVAPGERQIAVVEPGLAAARLSVTLGVGERVMREVVLSGEGLALVEDYRLELAEVSGGILEREAPSFTLSLVRPNGDAIALTDIAMVDAIGIAPGSADPETREGLPLGAPRSLTEFFSLSNDGTRLKANDPSAVRSILSQLSGQGQIVVMASNAETGLTYHAFVPFSIGAATIDGQLLAPPSNPSLRVDGVSVSLNVLGTADTIETLSDLDGAFFFDNVPLGLVTVRAETAEGEIFYVGSGTAFIDRDKEMVLRLLTTIDVVNGVDDFTITDSFFNIASYDEDPSTFEDEVLAAERQSMHEAWLEASDFDASVSATSGAQVSVFVIGGARDATIKDTRSLEIPGDLDQVTLRYTVSTAEYPTFVLAQSQFNDTWALEVRASTGQQLFDIDRNVNSQVRVQPQWRADGTTGEIVETIDLSSLPPTGGTTRMITVSAETQNIGDSILPGVVRDTHDRIVSKSSSTGSSTGHPRS